MIPLNYGIVIRQCAVPIAIRNLEDQSRLEFVAGRDGVVSGISATHVLHVKRACESLVLFVVHCNYITTVCMIL